MIRSVARKTRRILADREYATVYQNDNGDIRYNVGARYDCTKWGEGQWEPVFCTKTPRKDKPGAVEWYAVGLADRVRQDDLAPEDLKDSVLNDL